MQERLPLKCTFETLSDCSYAGLHKCVQTYDTCPLSADRRADDVGNMLTTRKLKLVNPKR